ncbi:sodium:proton exchanger [Candidatus Falkowbacteria bacterium CG10_big_fil_rev_8_21_14_0_10_37_6]|uniref:Sodium:proton exchanger n=1 Tax=Candidatus Falkowbacteria bacterium CG10_big_fil_rev_8_21_14_0_10_37_6 TaxID=1974563 RepID=A0A2H0V736_9BACT|nr:MAG: sodium:proton exchanger [Candidatus Falkowbacteria bacterium CG10_big_fil_rev_8_21_14_0_10_37_6]
MLTYILFIVGFVLLIKGADYLVEGSSSIGKRLGLTPLFIGLTIVAFGTSAPELFVNIVASFQGNAGIAVGNILGSNIANILLILGTAALITPLVVQTNTINKEIPLSFLAVVVLGVLVNDVFFDNAAHNILGRGDGFILIAFFIIFMYYAAGMRRAESQEMSIKEYKKSISWLMIAGGLAGLGLGSKWIVDGATVIAQQAGFSEALVGLSIIAIGTSLPELAASSVAAYKGKTDIAIGNVVGSNIFNIFWVLGLSSIIRPIEFSPSLNFDILMVVVATILLLIFLYIGKRQVLQRREGYLFLILYLAYIAFLFYRG